MVWCHIIIQPISIKFLLLLICSVFYCCLLYSRLSIPLLFTFFPRFPERIGNHKHTLSPSSPRSFQAGGGDKEHTMLSSLIALIFLLASVLYVWQLCQWNSDLTCARMPTWKILQFSFRSFVCLAQLCKLYECVFNFYLKQKKSKLK